MTEPTRMNVNVNAGQRSRGKISRPLTLERVIEYINLQKLDEYTTKGLIELAAKYPTAALPSFRKNFNLMLQRVRAKRKLEQTGEEIYVPEEIQPESEEGFSNIDEAFGQSFKTKENPEIV